jgi:hypothetical protein
MPGLRSGTPADAFTLRLNQSTTATLSWTPPPGAPGAEYLLAALNGNGLRVVPLAAGTTTATDNTAGQPVCYALFAFAGGQTIGTTDIICGIPGVSTL